MRTLSMSLVTAVVVLAASARATAQEGRPTDAEEQLISYMRTRMRSLAACYELGSTTPRKATVTLQVQPGGDVTEVSVESANSRGWSSCVSERIRAWKFPAFAGNARSVSYPLLYVAAR